MTQKQNLKTLLVFALFVTALGGWLLHLRAHPPVKNPINYIPFFIGVINIFFIPWMFLFRKTFAMAYVINGMSAIIGIILMANYSLHNLPDPLNIATLITKTTLADILIACGKFTIGKVIFDLEVTQLEKEIIIKYKFARYPNLGWWLIHLISIAAIFVIGSLILK